MTYGYARVSTKMQNLDRQVVELQNFGIEEKFIFQDKQSGKDFNRVNYQKLMKKLKKGDLLVIKSIDRLGRNYNMIIEEWARITRKLECDIVVLDMNLLDTRIEGNLVGKFISDVVLQVLSFVAENERDNIRKRQREGILIAKNKGVIFGRPKIKLPENFNQVIQMYRQKQINYATAMKLTNMSRGTFYKYFKEYLS